MTIAFNPMKINLSEITSPEVNDIYNNHEAESTNQPTSKTAPASRDEYLHEPPVEASGLYRLEPDENGKPRVIFDNPEMSDAGGKCTVNTDRVDREIQQLKEKKEQLEQQIRAAAGDEEKTKKLEQKLAQIEQELCQKDNDSYRRQNASVSLCQ